MFRIIPPDSLKITLLTHTTIEKCRQLLRESINNQPMFSGVNDTDIGGRIKGNKFLLWKRHISHRNSFAPTFYGNLTEEAKGTIVSGHFGLGVKWFLYVMYGTLIAGSSFVYLAGFTDILFSSRNKEISPSIFLAPLSAMLFLYGLTRVGTWLGKTEEHHIIDFLENTLKAHRSK
jgi:hypothetical protein